MRLQDADRHHVLRLRERRAAGASGLRTCRRSSSAPRAGPPVSLGIEDDRRVVDHGARHEALLERGRVDERLEQRSGLAPGLGHVVELVAVEVEAADQRADRAVLRSRPRRTPIRPPAAGTISKPPSASGSAGPRRRADAPRRLRLGVERARGEREAVAGDAHLVAALLNRTALSVGSIDDDRRPDVIGLSMASTSASSMRVRAPWHRPAGRCRLPVRGSRGAGRSRPPGADRRIGRILVAVTIVV